MPYLDKDIVRIMMRRAYDIAGCVPGVNVFLNEKIIEIDNFKSYIELYLKDKTDENGAALKIIHEIINTNWEIAVTLSNNEFQQVSFVNAIATSKGGAHVDYIVTQLTTSIRKIIQKEKEGKAIKPTDIKRSIFVFINCRIINPTFSSQTKGNLTLTISKFGSKCQINTAFIQNVLKCGIYTAIMDNLKVNAKTKLQTQSNTKKMPKIKGIPKLFDANNVGTSKSPDCTAHDRRRLS